MYNNTQAFEAVELRYTYLQRLYVVCWLHFIDRRENPR
jgi:hypothetical protein